MVDGFDAAFDHFVDINIQKDDLFRCFFTEKKSPECRLVKAFSSSSFKHSCLVDLDFLFSGKNQMNCHSEGFNAASNDIFPQLGKVQFRIKWADELQIGSH